MQSLVRCSQKYKNLAFQIGMQGEVGADTRIRTGDLVLTKDALYLLSYIS